MTGHVWRDRALLLHHLEWVLNHSRFGMLMIGLVGLSFVHEPWLAALIFVLFALEIGARVAIMHEKKRTNPYRESTGRRMDTLFLVLDVVGALSLWVTILDLPVDASGMAAARAARAVYLLRTLRFFRYLDLQSAMYSPTYGMVISLVVLLSFFATDTLLWVTIIFFGAELVVRAVLMRGMRFASQRERVMEWGFWAVDLFATLAMVPSLAVIPYGGALRMLRLVRLLRPWMVIVRNLQAVIREGQYLQEVNLIVLLLAVMSIGAGVIARLVLPDYDYTRDGVIDEEDHSLLAPMWFAFRLFSDPGNTVLYPEHPSIAVFSIIAPITGLFVLAFFIGIGASIVSGLMERLRNERLSIANHMVMLGWNRVAPFVIEHLGLLSERFHAALKLVLLHGEEHTPEEAAGESWIMTRRGDVRRIEDLARVNLRHARQAVALAPGGAPADQFAWGISTLMAARRENPDIYLTYALPGDAHPRLASHRHPFQIGWDVTGFYDKPTVVFSLSDVRANLLRNVVAYRDFDQIMHRLLVPERTEESALQICEFDARLLVHDGEPWLEEAGGGRSSLEQMAATMFLRGAVLVGVVPEGGEAVPLRDAAELAHGTPIRALLGISISPNALQAEALHALRDPLPMPARATMSFAPFPRPRRLRLLALGCVGDLPLLLGRLLDSFETVDVMLLDDVSPQEMEARQRRLEARLAQEGAGDGRVRIRHAHWDFHDMEVLRPYLREADRVLLGCPQGLNGDGFPRIAATLAHMATILREENLCPDVFPILERRGEARLLQEELERFDAGLEIHVVVPNEFFGAFVAHTSFQMYVAETPSAYELQRRLRHAVDDLMGDVGELDSMQLDALVVEGGLPDDAAAVFRALHAQGFLWIGYRMREAFRYSDPVQDWVRRFFPREHDFRCLRQHQIILNPFATPVSRYSWQRLRAQIAELIVIGPGRG